MKTNIKKLMAGLAFALFFGAAGSSKAEYYSESYASWLDQDYEANYGWEKRQEWADDKESEWDQAIDAVNTYTDGYDGRRAYWNIYYDAIGDYYYTLVDSVEAYYILAGLINPGLIETYLEQSIDETDEIYEDANDEYNDAWADWGTDTTGANATRRGYIIGWNQFSNAATGTDGVGGWDNRDSCEALVNWYGQAQYDLYVAIGTAVYEYWGYYGADWAQAYASFYRQASSAYYEQYFGYFLIDAYEAGIAAWDTNYAGDANETWAEHVADCGVAAPIASTAWNGVYDSGDNSDYQDADYYESLYDAYYNFWQSYATST